MVQDQRWRPIPLRRAEQHAEENLGAIVSGARNVCLANEISREVVVLMNEDSAASRPMKVRAKRSSWYRHLAALPIGLIAAGDQSAAAEPSGWAFEVTPYFLAAGLNGTAGARGVEADIDASFNDIWDKLDICLMGHFEARNGPWIVTIDAL